MGVACSSTWFLIVTSLAWALVASVAALGALHAPAEELGEAPGRAPHKAPRRFIVVRVPRSASLRPYGLAPDRDAARSLTPSI